MRKLVNIGRCIAATTASILAASGAAAQLTVLESGFTVTTLPAAVGAKQVECSPGGVWGNFIYAADSSGGVIERIDFAGNVTTFATGLVFPAGLDFGPGPGNNFGTFMYVTDFTTGQVSRIDPAGVVTPFSLLTSPGSNAFDPTGAYGNDMFCAAPAFSGPIVRLDSLGVSSFFSSVASTYLKFGPGGAWGTGMYSTDGAGISTIDVAGAATSFVSGFTVPEGFDWAFGPGWNGDMFACDVTTGEIWRVNPGGVRTLWATLPGAADVAFCNNDLYVVSFNGGCYKVTSNLVAVPSMGLWSFAILASLLAAALILAPRLHPRAPAAS